MYNVLCKRTHLGADSYKILGLKLARVRPRYPVVKIDYVSNLEGGSMAYLGAMSADDLISAYCSNSTFLIRNLNNLDLL